MVKIKTTGNTKILLLQAACSHMKLSSASWGQRLVKNIKYLELFEIAVGNTKSISI